MRLPDGRASRFSQIYIGRGAALQDNLHMRRRLLEKLPAGRFQETLAAVIQSELGEELKQVGRIVFLELFTLMFPDAIRLGGTLDRTAQVA
jgi:hypothetical protein